MRICKIFAPALLGWYLLVPPWSNGKTNTLAPFNSWEQFGSFDTAEACQNRKQGLFLASTADAGANVSAAERGRFEVRAAQLHDARCIEGDDPRLAK